MKQLNWYQIFGNAHKIPDGSTVTPTDDIQIWLNCANIWDKDYTTLAEVLADTDTLSALINSENAVDYMVRSTTWIGVTVPLMTSNTAPVGTVIYSTQNTNRPGYMAFDHNDSTMWQTGTDYSISNAYVGYHFTSAVKPTTAFFKVDNQVASMTAKVQGSNDGSNWTNVSEQVSYQSSWVTDGCTLNLDDSVAYEYYRLFIPSQLATSSGSETGRIITLNFYSASICDNSTAMSYIGLNNYAANTLLADSTWKTAIYQSEYKGSVLNITVPKMTSNTTPSGSCGGTSISSSSNDYWKAFNSSEALGWQPSGSDTFGVAKVYYHFTSKNLPCFACLKWIRSGATYSMTVKVIGSNDGTTWTEISPATVLYNNVDTDQILNAITGYEYVGIVVTYSEISITAGDGFKCQFYGREDV